MSEPVDDPQPFAELASRIDEKLYRERRWRFRVVTSLLPVVVGVLLLLLRGSIIDRMELRRSGSTVDRFLYFQLNTASSTIMLYSLVVLGLGMLLMLYLDTGFRAPKPSSVLASEESHVSEPPRRAAANLLGDSRYDITRTLEREGLSIGSPHEGQIVSPGAYIRQTTDRLNGELDALSYRVKLNLVIGILTTISGAGLLAYFVVVKQPPIKDFSSPSWYLAEFLPRLSIVLLIEVFAYFFLKLYKATLADVKYFQNELTNFECRALALATAVERDDAKSVSAVILELSKTERNFMNKNLTNLDLERVKVEQQSVTEILKHMASIVKSATGGQVAKERKPKGE